MLPTDPKPAEPGCEDGLRDGGKVVERGHTVVVDSFIGPYRYAGREMPAIEAPTCARRIESASKRTPRLITARGESKNGKLDAPRAPSCRYFNALRAPS